MYHGISYFLPSGRFQMPDFFSTITATPITSTDFGARFDLAWDTLAERFVKFECQQFYDEGDDSPYRDFIEGRIDSVIEKLVRFRREDAPFYEQAKARGARFLRIHAITLPLSHYLEYELHSYLLSELLGEQIMVISKDDAETLAAGRLQDFQVFDSRLLFVQSHMDGVFQGAVESNNPSDIQRALALVTRLEANAASFHSILSPTSSFANRLKAEFEKWAL